MQDARTIGGAKLAAIQLVIISKKERGGCYVFHCLKLHISLLLKVFNGREKRRQQTSLPTQPDPLCATLW